MIDLKTNPEVIVYADGSSLGNGKSSSLGGWGFAILDMQENLLISGSGHLRGATNNQMEMTGFLSALECLQRGHCVELWLDSQYVLKGTFEWMKGWKRNGWRTASGGDVKNVDLWKQINSAGQGIQFDPHWCKGHAGKRWNEFVDKLATTAAKRCESSEHGMDIRHHL